VTLEAIAKNAGVGIGTLYRHFPTRDALVEATYRNELTRLCEAAGQLLQALPPDEAMRIWMDHFVDCVTARRGMADALRALIASGGRTDAQSPERLTSAITTLVDAGSAAGTLRSDAAPADVLTGLSGIALAAGEPEQRDQAGRVLDLLMDGLRQRAAERAAPGGRS